MPRVAHIAFAALFVLTMTGRSAAQTVLRPDLSRVRGHAVPDVALVDDTGAPLQMSALAGKPVILNPIFTHCPYACPTMTASLRDALLAIGPPGDAYQVLTFTFDPADGAGELREYRERLALPEGWHVARGEPAQIDSLLSAIDFQTLALEDGTFAHPNAVAILAPDLTVSGFVTGLAYEETPMRRALAGAAAQTSLVQRYRFVWVGAAVAAALAMVLTLIVTRRRDLG